MGTINVEKLLNDMLTAANAAVKGKWPELKSYAEPEFRKIAEALVQIEVDKLSGSLTEDQAKRLIEMQKRSARSVLLACKGMVKVDIENAINAAIDVVNGAISKLWRIA